MEIEIASNSTGVGIEEKYVTHTFDRLDPLSLEHVFRKILHYLPFEDIKNCRNVCSDWEANISMAFRKRSLINLDSLERLENFRTTFSADNHHFVNFQLGPGIPMKSETCNNFFMKFGSSIQSIHFKNCDWSETGAILRILLEEKMTTLRELQLDLTTDFPFEDILHNENYLTVNLPNLRSLTVDFPVLRNCEWFVAEVRQFFYHLLLRTRRLESILYSGTKGITLTEDFTECYSCKIIFELIVNSAKLELPFLKRFDMMRRLNYDHLQRLEAKHFPIQSLYLLVEDDSLSIHSLCSLISSLRNTLHSLTIVFITQGIFVDSSYKPLQQLGILQQHYGYHGA